VADESNQPVIIVKKKGKGHGAHHGGAWKVAYADFVTAMMAFFLLLWLLNVTTDDQKKGIAQYFTPESVSRSTSGSGGILGGSSMAPGAMPRDSAGLVMGIPLAPTGEQSDQEAPDQTKPPENVQNPDPDAEEIAAAIKQSESQDNKTADKDKDKDNDKDFQGNISNAQLQKALAEKEQKDFQQAEAEIRQAIQQVPDLKPLQQNLIIDNTPEGLRIQIVDQQKSAMFPVGSPNPNQQMQELMSLIAKVVKQLPNPISVTGHTDSLPYPPGAQYTNWELSSDRANASRRALLDGGLTADRIKFVSGKADTDPLFKDPADPRNRRISIVLLRDVPLGSGPAPTAPTPGSAAATPPAGAAPASPAATPASSTGGGPAVPSATQARRPVKG
jgi:chemotaxis protein MotB